MVGWHHWLDGHEFEQAPGVGDGQGSLACCSPWCRKGSDTTVWLNWTELKKEQKKKKKKKKEVELKLKLEESGRKKYNFWNRFYQKIDTNANKTG